MNCNDPEMGCKWNSCHCYRQKGKKQTVFILREYGFGIMKPNSYQEKSFKTENLNLSERR